MEEISIGTGIAVFGAAFGMWAWVVAWGVSVMRKEMQDVKGQLTQVADSQHTHITQTERRLTMLEAEFSFVKARCMRIVDAQHES